MIRRLLLHLLGRSGPETPTAAAPGDPPPDDRPMERLFGDLITAWAEGRAPDQGIEAVQPGFAALFGESATAFTFDRFVHRETVEGWEWQPLEFIGHFEGTLHLYRPEPWTMRQKELMAQLLDAADHPRLSCFLTTRQLWAETLPDFLSSARIAGFDFLPQGDGISRWVFVTVDPPAHWCWGIYGAGELVFIAKGDASGTGELAEQLQALINSNPWYEWIAR